MGLDNSISMREGMEEREKCDWEGVVTSLIIHYHDNK